MNDTLSLAELDDRIAVLRDKPSAACRAGRGARPAARTKSGPPTASLNRKRSSNKLISERDNRAKKIALTDPCRPSISVGGQRRARRANQPVGLLEHVVIFLRPAPWRRS